MGQIWPTPPPEQDAAPSRMWPFALCALALIGGPVLVAAVLIASAR